MDTVPILPREQDPVPGRGRRRRRDRACRRQLHAHHGPRRREHLPELHRPPRVLLGQQCCESLSPCFFCVGLWIMQGVADVIFV